MFNTIFVCYWGFEGKKDYAEKSGFPVDKVDNANLYLHLGAGYSFGEFVRVQLTGYHLLGLFDEDLSSRNYYDLPTYRIQAPSVSLSVSVEL
ncbi:MAG: hypothetical protein GY754_34345 [bacterium]|nr:hypothetical protein [bacterium]